jgi:ribonuclease HI
MLEIYTDGACSIGANSEKSKMGKLLAAGGYGVVMVKDGEQFHIYSRRDNQTTNNRMELSAIIRALKLLVEYNDKHGNPGAVKIYSDSQYCVRSANEWLPNWEKNGFKNVQNVDLWNEFVNYRDKVKALEIPITFIWVKGHAQNKFNVQADQLAVAAKQGAEVRAEMK